MALTRLVPLLGAALACASTAEPGPLDPVREGGRAALAVLVVDNRTGTDLRVSFLLPVLSQGEVHIGEVPARSVRRMPPVPAGEPLLVIARSSEGREFRLGPRSLPSDQAWRWVISPDAGSPPGNGR
jgi:hypothetical protein